MSDRDTTDGHALGAGRGTGGSTGLGSWPRPTRVSIDPKVCERFGTCLAVAPVALRDRVHDECSDRPVRSPRTATDEGVVVTSAVLDAMAACPTGAIRWVERNPGNVGADPP